MPGKCRIQESWLKKAEYKDWILSTENKYTAKCGPCSKIIQLGAMGESILRQHSNGLKHKKLVKDNQCVVKIAEFADNSEYSMLL